MSRTLNAGVLERLSFPRVSGDEPWSVVRIARLFGFSPRERG